MRICVALSLVFPLLANAGPQRVQKQHARIESRLLEQLQNTTSRPGVKQEAADRYLERYGHLDIRPVRRVEGWRATLPADPAPDKVESTPSEDAGQD